MEDNGTIEKLRKNIDRLIGISTLRKIRNMVDSINEQDRKNRSQVIFVLLITVIMFVSVAIYIAFNV